MRSHQYRQGRRSGVKACVEWLHKHAATMNDPHARAVLNSAALGMGTALKRRFPVGGGEGAVGGAPR